MPADDFAFTLGRGDHRPPLQQMDRAKILGIEGGGTKTAWALVANGAIIESGKLPASNLRLTPLDQITEIFRVLPREGDRIGVFFAGCGTEEDRAGLL